MVKRFELIMKENAQNVLSGKDKEWQKCFCLKSDTLEIMTLFLYINKYTPIRQKEKIKIKSSANSLKITLESQKHYVFCARK